MIIEKGNFKQGRSTVMDKKNNKMSRYYMDFLDRIISICSNYNRMNFTHRRYEHLKDPFWTIPELSCTVIINDFKFTLF